MGRPLMDPARLAEALALVAAGSTAKEAAEQMTAAGRRISWRTIYNAQTDGRAAALAAAAPLPSSGPTQKLVAYRPAARPMPGPFQASASAPGSGAGATADDDEESAGGIDAAGTPLAVMRGLLASASRTIRQLPPDSPRLNPARAEARALAKGIDALESRQAALETPEEAERRRRADDGETRAAILRHVERAEAEAAAPRLGAPHGVCVTCGAPRAEAGAA